MNLYVNELLTAGEVITVSGFDRDAQLDDILSQIRQKREEEEQYKAAVQEEKASRLIYGRNRPEEKTITLP